MKLITFSLSLLILTFNQVECERLNSLLNENEVFLNKLPLASSIDINEYFCPSLVQIEESKNILFEDFNEFMYEVPGGDKYYQEIENVASFFQDWKYQFFAYKNSKGEKSIYINLIKNTKSNEFILEHWREEYVFALSDDEQLNYSFNINLDRKNITF